MIAFLDFEASSLSERSFPIKVAWVFEDGTGEAHLIRPAPGWTDWDAEAEAIHKIPRAELLAHGETHETVARRMVQALTGHRLHASAPSWDGKWMSKLLRAADLPRRALQLRDTDVLLAEAARAIFADAVPEGELEHMVESLLTIVDMRSRSAPPAHRALADAEAERQRWICVKETAQAALAARAAGQARGQIRI